MIAKTLYQYKPDIKDKLGTEISFAVIGDQKFDEYGLQIAPFGKGVTLDKYLKALHAEGAGGPGVRESYELMAYFALNHIKTPNAKKPFLFVIGDEMFYDSLTPETVKKVFGDSSQGSFDSMALWKEVADKYEAFFLRKPYPPYDEQIMAQWTEALGPQHVVPIYDMQRVADVIMGMVALNWCAYDDFKLSMSARQDEKSIAVVEKSLLTAPGLIKSKSGQLLLPSKTASKKI